jgi:uncharacterized protein YegL
MKYLVALLFATVCTAGDNIVVLLDTSGSMADRMRDTGRSRIEAARSALYQLAEQLPADTNIGLLTFQGWQYQLGPLDKEKFRTAVAKAGANGGTPLGEYMKAGADVLLQQRAKSPTGIYKLVIVTDGDATDGAAMHKNFADILRRGLLVDSIGVDMGSDHALSKGSHRYMRADDEESLAKAVSKAVGEVGGDNVTQEYDLIDGFPESVGQGDHPVSDDARRINQSEKSLQ